jgi:hypothetical protein
MCDPPCPPLLVTVFHAEPVPACAPEARLVSGLCMQSRSRHSSFVPQCGPSDSTRTHLMLVLVILPCWLKPNSSRRQPR